MKWATSSAFKHIESAAQKTDRFLVLCVNAPAVDGACAMHTIQFEWHFGSETVQLRETRRTLHDGLVHKM